MVTAMGFLQVLLLVRQMESVTTQALAARVSLFAMAHQVGGWRRVRCRNGCGVALAARWQGTGVWQCRM